MVAGEEDIEVHTHTADLTDEEDTEVTTTIMKTTRKASMALADVDHLLTSSASAPASMAMDLLPMPSVVEVEVDMVEGADIDMNVTLDHALKVQMTMSAIWQKTLRIWR